MKNFGIKVNGRLAEVWIYGEIRAARGQALADELSSLDRLDKITVRINCPGGDPVAGLAIYRGLAENGAWIRVLIDGFAGEIGAVIAMAGHSIEASSNSFLMIDHSYEPVRGQVFEIFRRRANRPKHIMSSWMRTPGKWFTAREALESGLVCRVFGEANGRNFAKLDMARLKAAPEALVAMARQTGGKAKVEMTPIRKKILANKLALFRQLKNRNGR